MTRLLALAVGFLAITGCRDTTLPPLPPGDPVAMAAVAGNGQEAVAGTTFLPLSALVTDANGTPVPGIPVVFGFPGPYMSFLTIDTISTGGDGIARLEGLRAGSAGTRTVSASVADRWSSQFVLKTVVGPPSRIEMGPYSVLKRQASSEWTATARVVDAGGNALPGRAVTFSIGGPGGTVAPSVVSTDAEGTATTRWTLGPTLSTYTLTATHDTVRRTITLAAVSGAPASIARASADSLRVIVGGVASPAVLVTDAAGLPVPDATVRWTPAAGSQVYCGMYPDDFVTVSDSLGIARCRVWRLDQTGPSTATATLGTATTSFSAVALPVPASIAIVSAPDTLQEVRTDTELPSDVVIEVRMSDGTPAIGYPIRFEPGGGSVSPSTALTDANGRASTRWRTTIVPGRTTLVAALDVATLASRKSDTTSVRAYGPPVLGFVFAGRSHTCAMGALGLLCWGSNSSQQAGAAGGAPDRLLPTWLNGVMHATRYWALGDHSCAQDWQSDGHLHTTIIRSCWGLGPDGVQTYGGPTQVPSTAYQLPGLARTNVDAPVTTRVDGALHGCVMTSLGSVFCVGRNDHGQLGDGTTTDRAAAARVAGVSFVTGALALGESHTCGRSLAGTWMCWGRNDAGQLGDGTAVDRTSPVAISGGAAFVTLAAGVAHTCGLAASGSVYCWGSNANGQLGTGTIGGSASTPKLVLGGRTFVRLAVGDHHTCGSLANGLAYCWGRNDHGQLGDGTTTDRGVPTSIGDYH
jgi:alpha-tubulin suppressor-like RCC1 family protein